MLSPWPNSDYERRWHEAISADSATRLSALNFWARHLDQLPGPILFTIPRSEQLLGKWQRVMRLSTPYCACGERRWLLPDYSVPFYPPPDPAPITVGAGRQLALGAWGADTQQTQIQVSVQDGFIVTHMLPYSTLSHAELAALGVRALGDLEVESDADGRLHIRGLLLGGGPIVRDSLEKLAQDISEQQRPINRLNAIGIEGTNQVLSWTVYQATKVDLSAGTMEVRVSATAQIMDRSQRAHPHVCTLKG